MSERTTKDSNRSTNGKAKAKVAAARRRSEPRLGELEFSEWYETPVFEPSNEERIETMATGGRAPSRLVARVVLAAGARRERRRAERQHQEPNREESVQSVAGSPAPAAPAAAPEPAPESAPEPALAAVTSPAPEPAAVAAEVTSPELAPDPVAVATAVMDDPVPRSPEISTEPIVEALEPPPALTADDGPELREPDPELPAAAATAATAASAAPPTPAAPAPAPAEATGPEPVLIPELVDRPGWRRKASDLLDRWAEKEVAVATKLDEALAPAIPWTRKPAHSRRHRSS
ncbi:MAG TPA: hypothetical protein VFZ97_01430 [Acidimicrobiales bacterium]